MQIDPYLLLCIKLKPKWIKHLNINPDTLYLKKQKMGKNLENTDTEDNFLNRTPIVLTLRLIINGTLPN